MKIRETYVNTTIASLAFILLLTFGFVWTTYHPQAPFGIYTEGLVLAFGVVTGKRLWQKWQGKGKGFALEPETKPKKKDEDDEIPWR